VPALAFAKYEGTGVDHMFRPPRAGDLTVFVTWPTSIHRYAGAVWQSLSASCAAARTWTDGALERIVNYQPTSSWIDVD